MVFGLFFGITFVLGDIRGRLALAAVLMLGLIMAVVLVGLVGWPLMNATISTEGSDSFDALSRSYSYVYQVPWHCLWYAAGAPGLRGGARLLRRLHGLAARLPRQMGRRRRPTVIDATATRLILFMYAPTSFGWRDVLLKDSPSMMIKTNAGHYRDYA